MDEFKYELKMIMSLGKSKSIDTSMLTEGEFTNIHAVLVDMGVIFTNVTK